MAALGGRSGTRLVLLGTCGGPWPAPFRMGVAQAVVVGDRTYLIDCGSGVAHQMVRARILRRLEAVFVTHLHSDHVCDFFNLFLLGWSVLQPRPRPIPAYGPGPAGGAAALPPDVAGHPPFPLANPSNPTPGLFQLAQSQFDAYAYDINVRVREAGRSDIRELIDVQEITLPDGLGASPPDDVCPPMEPFQVAEDDYVRVSAILVNHPPVFPAFAYRFDTDDGSIVISGDTTPTPNLVRLAQDADILVHEVLDVDYKVRFTRSDDDRTARLRHLITAHTPLDTVGKIAAEANAKTLVLSHLIPSWTPQGELPEEHWATEAQAGFDGKVVVGRDLMELWL